MVKKKRAKLGLIGSFLLPKNKKKSKKKKVKVQTIKKVSIQEISKSLEVRRKRTAMRILESTGASKVSKERARKLIGL